MNSIRNTKDYLPTPRSMEAMALHYQSEGLRIFPLVLGAKKPYRIDSWGYRLMLEAKDRLLTPDEIIGFWQKHPEANIGLFAGEASGISIIDVDTNEKNTAKHPDWVSGYKTLKSQGLSHLLDVGLAVTTPSDGYQLKGTHLYFKYTDRLPHGKRNDLGIEVFNSKSNYILLPPSHYWLKGKPRLDYTFDSIHFEDFRVDELPEFPRDEEYFIKLLGGKTNKSSKARNRYSPSTAYSGPPPVEIGSGPMRSVFTKRKEINGKVSYGEVFPEKVQLNAKLRRDAKLRLKHQIENTGLYDIADRWKLRLKELNNNWLSSGSSEDLKKLEEAKAQIQQQVKDVVDYIKDKRYLKLSSKSKPEKWAVRYRKYFYALDTNRQYVPTGEELSRIKVGDYWLRLDDGSVVAKFNLNQSTKANPKWYYLKLEHPIEIEDII